MVNRNLLFGAVVKYMRQILQRGMALASQEARSQNSPIQNQTCVLFVRDVIEHCSTPSQLTSLSIVISHIIPHDLRRRQKERGRETCKIRDSLLCFFLLLPSPPEVGIWGKTKKMPMLYYQVTIGVWSFSSFSENFWLQLQAGKIMMYYTTCSKTA